MVLLAWGTIRRGAGSHVYNSLIYLWLADIPFLVEERAHKLLREYRKRGEWFECSAAVGAQAVKEAAIAVDSLLEDAEIPVPNRLKGERRAWVDSGLSRRTWFRRKTRPLVPLSAQGRRPGRPRRGKADQTLERTKPWIIEGISRRTWFRRQKTKNPTLAHIDTIN